MDFSKNAPNGGFPSIYVVSDKETETTTTEETPKLEPKNKKKRGAEVMPQVASIKEILTKRRHATPFIALAPEEEK